VRTGEPCGWKEDGPPWGLAVVGREMSHATKDTAERVILLFTLVEGGDDPQADNRRLDAAPPLTRRTSGGSERSRVRLFARLSGPARIPSGSARRGGRGTGRTTAGGAAKTGRPHGYDSFADIGRGESAARGRRPSCSSIAAGAWVEGGAESDQARAPRAGRGSGFCHKIECRGVGMRVVRLMKSACGVR